MKGVTCSDEPSENEQLNLQLYRRQLIVLLSSPQRKASFSGGSCFSSNKTYKIWLYITCSAPQTPKANAGLTNRLNIGLSFVKLHYASSGNVKHFVSIVKNVWSSQVWLTSKITQTKVLGYGYKKQSLDWSHSVPRHHNLATDLY